MKSILLFLYVFGMVPVYHSYSIGIKTIVNLGGSVPESDISIRKEKNDVQYREWDRVRMNGTRRDELTNSFEAETESKLFNYRNLAPEREAIITATTEPTNNGVITKRVETLPDNKAIGDNHGESTDIKVLSKEEVNVPNIRVSITKFIKPYYRLSRSKRIVPADTSFNSNLKSIANEGKLVSRDSNITDLKASCEISSVQISCACGKDGPRQQTFVSQCSYEDLRFMTRVCGPCETACEKFRFCRTCTMYDCQTCPPMRYGQYCEFVQTQKGTNNTNSSHSTSEEFALSVGSTHSFVGVEIVAIICLLYYLLFI